MVEAEAQQQVGGMLEERRKVGSLQDGMHGRVDRSAPPSTQLCSVPSAGEAYAFVRLVLAKDVAGQVCCSHWRVPYRGGTQPT